MSNTPVPSTLSNGNTRTRSDEGVDQDENHWWGQGSNLKKGDTIQYKLNNNDPWEKAVIIGRAARATSKIWNHAYNVKNSRTGEEFYINLNSIKDWRKLRDPNRSNQNLDRSANTFHLDYESDDEIFLSDHPDLENDLRRKWVTVGGKIAFAGIDKIYEHYKRRLSKEQIKKILYSIPTYTKFREFKSPKTHNPYFIYYLNQMWQCDLCYLQEFKTYNNGIAYLLCVIECFSRKMFIFPLRDKSATSTLHGFKQIHDYIAASPKIILSDQGIPNYFLYNLY